MKSVKKCNYDIVTIVCISISVILVLIGTITGVVYYVRKKRNNNAEPTMEKNEEYGVDDDDYYNEFDTRVQDNNDYYNT